MEKKIEFLNRLKDGEEVESVRKSMEMQESINTYNQRRLLRSDMLKNAACPRAPIMEKMELALKSFEESGKVLQVAIKIDVGFDDMKPDDLDKLFSDRDLGEEDLLYMTEHTDAEVQHTDSRESESPQEEIENKP